MSMKDLPADARPREKLLARGPQALSDVELLAILLRTGMAGKNVFQLSEELLGTNGIAGLLNATVQSLRAVKGLGPAKQAELLAVFEMARRALSQGSKSARLFTRRAPSNNTSSCSWPTKTMRSLPCCFWRYCWMAPGV